MRTSTQRLSEIAPKMGLMFPLFTHHEGLTYWMTGGTVLDPQTGDINAVYALDGNATRRITMLRNFTIAPSEVAA